MSNKKQGCKIINVIQKLRTSGVDYATNYYSIMKNIMIAKAKN